MAMQGHKTIFSAEERLIGGGARHVEARNITPIFLLCTSREKANKVDIE